MEINDYFPPPRERLDAPGGLSFYGVILLLVTAAVIAAFMVEADIGITVPGMIRPQSEPAEIKSPVAGKICFLNLTEGKYLKKGETIAVIENKKLEAQYHFHRREQIRLQKLVRDLTILTKRSNKPTDVEKSALKTPQLRQQLELVQAKCREQEFLIQRIKKEVEINARLREGGAIAPNDAFQKHKLLEQTEAAVRILVLEQVSSWERELQQAMVQLREQETFLHSVIADQQLYRVSSPVSGTIDQQRLLYDQSLVQQGEFICSIIPDTTAIIECFIPTSRFGKLRVGNPIHAVTENSDTRVQKRIRGMLISVSEDHLLKNGVPVYRVRCSIDTASGTPDMFRNGITLRCRFITGRKKIAQIVWGRIEDILNP